jgi:class 3 adenylate cyclase/tetratricopeptide (TPR) repeat protein
MRKLTTIFYADVVGYSRLTGDDELRTHQAVMDALDYTNTAIDAEGGTVLRYAGDAILAEFPSVVSCVNASVTVQTELASRNQDIPDDKKVQLRIGINLGEVLIDRGEIYGDGVNIAARLESIAVPGGVCISHKVGAEVKGKLEVSFTDGGEYELKNIAEPLKVLHWHPDAGMTLPIGTAASEDTSDEGSRPNKKPNLMLMPFESLGDDDQTKTLAASVTEEILGPLTKLTGISLVTTSDVADYVAKGSVRVAGNRFRASVQLHDQSEQKPFWSDRFDSDMEDMFEALDNLAVRISTALRYEIYERETAKSKLIPVEKQSSQELMGQAGHILFQSRRADYEKSRELISVVIEREPDNPMALAIAAWGRAGMEVICGYGEIADEDGDTGLKYIRRSIELNELSDFAHMVYGRLLLHWERDISAAILEAERSLELTPGYVLAMDLMGAAKSFSGDPESGIEYCTKAVEADARFPANHWFMEDIALGNFIREDYDTAVTWARRADQKQRGVASILLMLTTACWHAGQHDSAHQAAERLVEASPGFRMGDLRRWNFQDPAHWERFRQGLVEAGLPE